MRIATAYLLALVAVLVGAYYGFPDLFQAPSESSAAAEGPSAPTVTPVIVAVAKRAPMVGSIEALGTVNANESIEVTPNGSVRVQPNAIHAQTRAARAPVSPDSPANAVAAGSLNPQGQHLHMEHG